MKSDKSTHYIFPDGKNFNADFDTSVTRRQAVP